MDQEQDRSSDTLILMAKSSSCKSCSSSKLSLITCLENSKRNTRCELAKKAGVRDSARHIEVRCRLHIPSFSILCQADVLEALLDNESKVSSLVMVVPPPGDESPRSFPPSRVRSAAMILPDLQPIIFDHYLRWIRHPNKR